MPVQKTPSFSPTVAARILKEHGLEGKVTPEALVRAAQAHDVKNPGYISADEFKKAAADLAKTLGGAAQQSAGTSAPTGQTYSPVFARGAAVGSARPRADMSDPRLQYAQERILANTGRDGRFGGLKAGAGLRAFVASPAVLAQLNDPALKDKLKQAGDGAVVAILKTDDKPSLTIASATAREARVVAEYDLLHDDASQVLGSRDTMAAVARLLGQEPAIPLGGEKASWSLATSSWASGEAFAPLKAARDEVDALRRPPRDARQAAAAAAMKGPSTVEDFSAAGVKGHKHTAAEKKALLELVTKNAGEDAIFPNPDDSYYGMHTFLMEGPAAAHAVAVAVAGGGGPAKGYDPEKHSVLVTLKSFDEAQVGTFVVDRATQKVLFANEVGAQDHPTAVLDKFFPGGPEDMGLVVGTFAQRGELLGVVKGSDEPDDMDFRDWLPTD